MQNLSLSNTIFSTTITIQATRHNRHVNKKTHGPQLSSCFGTWDLHSDWSHHSASGRLRRPGPAGPAAAGAPSRLVDRRVRRVDRGDVSKRRVDALRMQAEMDGFCVPPNCSAPVIIDFVVADNTSRSFARARSHHGRPLQFFELFLHALLQHALCLLLK